MKIVILGSKGEHDKSAPKHSKKSGILIDDKILFDLGEDEYLKHDPDYIFITHLHPDHAFFIKDDIEGIKAPVYSPEQTNKINSLNVIKDEIQVESYKITPIPTHHSKLVDSVAYIIEDNKDKRVLYTGDLIWINKEYHSKFKDLNLVITDGSYLRKGGLVRKDKETGQIFGHTGIPDLIKLFKPFTDKIIFTHFGSWFYKDIKESRKKIKALDDSVKIEVAYDGMKIKI
ncbi:MAG: MBL fold metallo-hydrolase [Candidatus Lokiarchaeota archaeon]|nr:MBL fold metallo-hydrolase [Candidatus Lokiarchaeota archaeon]